jgi:branched-subunit amino acid ABC-type transport system permease component
MEQQIQWIIEGAPIGCVYALVAVGLVLTYKTSGVFNLAFSAQAFLSGWVFYDTVENRGWPLWLGFVMAVLIVSPLIGLLLDRALFRYMRTASWQVKLVTALGLLLAMPEIVKAIFGPQPAQAPPSVASLLGLEQGGLGLWEHLGFESNFDPNLNSFHIGDYIVQADRAAAVIVTLVAVVLLGLLFRYTAIGLQMRAVVESPRMVELAGVDSDRVSMVSWMLSSVLAGLAGILLAPLYFELNANIYTLLIIAAIAAAAVGRFQSIPMTLVGGLFIGIAARALPDLLGADSAIAVDLRPSFPFLVLFVLLVFWPKLRESRDVADPLAGVDPPPPALAHEYKDEQMQRMTRIAFPVFVGGFLVVMMTIVSPLWVTRLTDAFALAVVLLSITIFTGLGGQISLAQATFAGFGGFAMANLMQEWNIPALLAIVIGGLVAAAAGALFVLLIDGLPALIGRLRRRPTVRLAGLYLSLATLAFALMAENVIFRREEISGGEFGIEVRRPEFANLANDPDGRVWFLVVFAIFAIVGFMVILIRKGTIGRYLGALRGSETAAASIGVNATSLRIIMFSLAAGVAGLGGGLIGMSQGRVEPIATYPALFGVVWVVLVVTLGARTVDGAVNAALGLIVTQWLLETLGFPTSIAIIGFGLGAITYARHPEGIVQFQTRKSILAQRRQAALKRRADELGAAATRPKGYRPVWHVVLPVIAGPALYLLYILVRSPIQGHWVTVHSSMILWFIVPSLLVALAWIFWTDARLRKGGGVPQGLLLLLGGALVGAAVGWFFHDQAWVPRATLLDCVLVGIPAGIGSVAFFLLPVHVERIAKVRGWLSSPITWHAGRAPFGFVLAGAFLFFRTSVTDQSQAEGSFIDHGFPPSGWPVAFLTTVFVIVWTRWIADVQGACNELAIGGEGFEPPPEHAVPLASSTPEPLVAASAGEST